MRPRLTAEPGLTMRSTARVRSAATSARAAVAAGADGVLVEVHVSPETALCDGQQSLSPAEFAGLADQLRIIASAVGRSVAGARPAEGG